MQRPPREVFANIAGTAGLVGLALIAGANIVHSCSHHGAPSPAGHGASAASVSSALPASPAAPVAPAAPASSDGSARSDPSAPSSPAEAAADWHGADGVDPYDEASTSPSIFAEAQRLTLAHPGYRELLSNVIEEVEQRFPGAAPSSIELQVVPLPDAQRAVLLHRRGQGQRPLLFVFDSDRQMVWTRERPLAGLDAGINEVALCPGPDGEVVLFWYDTPTRLVAARRLEKGGRLLADFKLMPVEGVESLSALYWPGRGWLVATSGQGAVRAQLLTEQGKLPWGNDGRHLTQQGALRGPLSVALDTEMSAVLVWPGASQAVGGRPPAPHYQAMRIDIAGLLLWRAPLDPGPAPAAGAPPRATLDRISNGVMRVDLTRDAPAPPGATPYSVEVTAEGQVLVR